MNALLCAFTTLLTIKTDSCNEKVRGTNQNVTILDIVTNTRKFVTENEKILERVDLNQDLIHNIYGIDLNNHIYRFDGVLALNRELSNVYNDAWLKKDWDKTNFLLKFCYPMYDYALLQINGELRTEISRYALTFKRTWLTSFKRGILPLLDKVERKYSKESREKLLECASSGENGFCEIYSKHIRELNFWVKNIRSHGYNLSALIDASKQELFNQDLTKLIKMILVDPLHKCMHESERDCELDPYTTLSWKIDHC